MNLTTRYTEEMVSLVKSYCDDSDEGAAPEGGGSFAEYAVISFPGLRIFPDETYEMEPDSMIIPLKSLECEVRHGVTKVDL